MTLSTHNEPRQIELPLSDRLSFIETQFPVAKVSIESYKERKAVSGQTLPGLGRWWGRKPLILVRASLIGLLMPSTDNPEKDREIFLKILTMDEQGMLSRRKSKIPKKRLIQELKLLPSSIQAKFLVGDEINRDLSKDEIDSLQELIFKRLPYSEKLDYCLRPEQVPGPAQDAWDEINAHLGTNAKNLPALVQELGNRLFDHVPSVGDAFCGGGSIPFEAARLGCDTYGSDLNPIAALLTWASINFIGGGEEITKNAYKNNESILHALAQITLELGIEHNSLGWQADAYIYCMEVTDPESGWKIPLLPTFAISPKHKVIARLIPVIDYKCYEIEIIENVSDEVFQIAEKDGTVKDSRLFVPGSSVSIPIEVLRNNMRFWESKGFVPRPDDIFQERLYCIRWLETIKDSTGKEHSIRHFRAPNQEDLRREAKVEVLLRDRFEDWQAKGYIPSRVIEPGAKTDEPIRTRGWTHWHHLFNPRQLLINGLISQQIDSVPALLFLGKIIDRNSKLSRWNSHNSAGIGSVEQIFSNQALNTLYNFGSRPSISLNSLTQLSFTSEEIKTNNIVDVADARTISVQNDIWITDPPYADAVNYEEISEFFLAWYAKHLERLFPDWYSDSKRALAVKGTDQNFRLSMVECYKRLVANMPENGMQIVMFTHQSASVWADLSLILWAAGLRVTAAWTIATETNSALKSGNYVQGTVLLVLRKRINKVPLFLDEISHKVEDEVKRQLDTMTRLEDDSDPNFGDADYQLAAYAAALRVLTSQPIEEIDPEKEILRERAPGEIGPVEQLIRRAVKIACDHLIPRGLDAELWKSFGPMERFYIKGLEVESHGEYRSGVYQELARGFGATDYTDLMENTKANETRLMSASEFNKRMSSSYQVAGDSFASSLVRTSLFAIWLTAKSEETKEGLNYLHTEMGEMYWANRDKLVKVLDYLATLRNTVTMQHWQKDSHAAEVLAGAVRNDHI